VIGPITRYDCAVTERAGGGLMAGPKDRALDQQQGPDSVRTRESDPVGAGLRQRLELLPPGHPSSPYNDDGSRKPPVPDPFEHDYPIPGDPDYAPADDDAGRELPFRDREGIPDSDSREQTERRLSQITDQLADRCREAEGRDPDGNYTERGLTPAMRRIEAQLEHGRLVPDTEKYALKSADRLKLKLAERINLQPGTSADVLASRIHDGIRYTFEYDDQDYTIGVEETEEALEESGYELIARKPSWDSPDYKGVNSQWRDPDSRLAFEIQFHTRVSWDAKQKTHFAYERLSDPRTLPEERAQLDSYQKEVTASVPVPPGALEIPYYHKKDV